MKNEEIDEVIHALRQQRWDVDTVEFLYRYSDEIADALEHHLGLKVAVRRINYQLGLAVGEQ